ncbi:phosphatidylserine/phosphatidylglycerophosphate/cardiolipin synthase family protein [Lacisediminimonas sp.]|uniref:phospholipase D-like domain-containing protein n=1 Tax=Lacisediminimonas sp. TaxID=3060582 RepID=UPI00271AE879|nr:phospholipase D-like domain-containing protein [Lacisediminimonas sp.]MDO8298681.1 phospholipase D-like domain-containing protein [Lacisediminimonas sp.]
MRAIAYTAGNDVTLLHRGDEYFPALIAAFDAARSEIWLETYIFALDPTGDQVKAALIRAAGRGVAVHVVTDWLGTGHRESAILQREFLQAGVSHRSFNPWFRRGVTRMHRKMCVIDADLAYLGGLNIIDDMVDDGDPSVRLPAPRWDFAIRIAGPLVDAIDRELKGQWARLGKLPLISRIEGLMRPSGPRTPSDNAPAVAALIVRDSFRNRVTIQRAYLHALGHARRDVLLVTPYFAPGRKLRAALESAASRGVRVTLLLGVGQFSMQDAVAHSYYPKLMRAGVHIVEYRKTQLHGKVAVIDEDWATVGSSNCDGLSLFVNQEANIVVRDAEFSRALREHILSGLAEGSPVKLDEFSNRPLLQRLGHGAAFLLYRAVMRVITLGEYN